MKLLPSIASANQMDIGGEIRRLKDWGYLHIDIEDGNFLPNITFGMKTVWGVARQAADKELDVHLLVTDPMAYLQPMAGLGVRRICAHIEALPYPLQFLNKAKELGMRAGLSLNLATPLEALSPFVPAMDYCLLMTAEPDGRGDLLYEPAVQRVERMCGEYGSQIEIFADGGLDEATLRRLHAAGLHAAVLGRLAFGAEDPHQTLQELDKNLRQHRAKQ